MAQRLSTHLLIAVVQVQQERMYARALVSEGDLKGAVSMLNSLLDSNPTNILLLKDKIRILCKIGNFEQAVSALGSVLEQSHT